MLSFIYKASLMNHMLTKAFDIPVTRLFKHMLRGLRGTSGLIRLHASEHPNKIAITHGDRNITWRQLFEGSVLLASGLKNIGVKAGDRVVICMRNCPEFIESTAAISFLGAYFVPASAHLKPGELQYILEDANAVAVICDHNTFDSVQQAAEGIKVIAKVDGDVHDALKYENLKTEEEWRKEDVIAEMLRRKASPAGAILYTSGTTGKPKGAMRGMERAAKVMSMMIYELSVSYRDVHLVVAPMYHAAPAAISTIHFLTGARLVIQDKFDPENFLAEVDRRWVTTTFVVPTMLVDILNLPVNTLRKYNISSLRMVLCAGAPLKEEVKRRFIETFGGTLYEFYGATETGMNTLLKPADYHKLGSVGRVLPMNDVRIFSEDGKRLGVEQVGEICLRTDALMSGYYRRAEETRKQFFGKYFRTGDVGYIDKDGYLYIVDRKKDMIISGGVNIYPAEVEGAILEHHAVEEVAVVGMQDERWGETPAAFVVTRAGSNVTESDIINFCKKKMAGFKVPKKVVFVEQLPKNPQGKVLKRVLKDTLK
jgi:fatty-acyl-CoA synthase